MHKIYFIFLVFFFASIFHLAQAEELDVTEINAATEAFSFEPNAETRQQLADALEAYSGEATVESVKAYLLLLDHDTMKGSHRVMRETALATVAHLEPVKDVIPQAYIEAKYLSAVALFNQRQHRDSLLEMAHVEGFTKYYLDSTGEQPAWADRLQWQADAWGLAMRAFYNTTGKRAPTDAAIDAVLESYVPLNTGFGDDEMGDEPNRLPPCAGKLVQSPRLRYPQNKAMRGMYGAVILHFAFDKEGRVVDPKVKASVPAGEFDSRSLRVVQQWHFKPDNKRAVGVSCQIENPNVVLPITFQLY